MHWAKFIICAPPPTKKIVAAATYYYISRPQYGRGDNPSTSEEVAEPLPIAPGDNAIVSPYSSALGRYTKLDGSLRGSSAGRSGFR